MTRLTYSVVVLSYNQAPFVAEAVRGVLAQDCAALEIIISDDCSTDATFDIIRQTARDYAGPHRVTLRRNPENIGLVAHINLVTELSTGDVIVPAYGDDISLPSRVRELARAFEVGEPWLVHSDAIAIDETGAETRTRYRKADFYRTTDPLETATSMALYLGAAGAWHRRIFTKYGPLGHPALYDDHVLGFRAALEGGVAYLEKPLVKYREGVGLSHQLAKETRSSRENAARRRKILELSIATFEQRLTDAATFGLPGDHPVVRKLRRALQKARLRRACHDGIARMLLANARTPGAALSAACAEGLRLLRRR